MQSPASKERRAGSALVPLLQHILGRRSTSSWAVADGSEPIISHKHHLFFPELITLLELICLFSAHSPRLVRSSCCLSPLAWHFTIWGSLKFSRNMETSLVLWLNNHLEKHQLGLAPVLFHAVKGPLTLPLAFFLQTSSLPLSRHSPHIILVLFLSL